MSGAKPRASSMSEPGTEEPDRSADEERALAQAAREASERVLQWRSVRWSLTVEFLVGVFMLLIVLADAAAQYLVLSSPAPRPRIGLESTPVNPIEEALRAGYAIGGLALLLIALLSRILAAGAPRDSGLRPSVIIAAILLALAAGLGGLARWAAGGRTGLLPPWLVAASWAGALLAVSWVLYVLFLHVLHAFKSGWKPIPCLPRDGDAVCRPPL